MILAGAALIGAALALSFVVLFGEEEAEDRPPMVVEAPATPTPTPDPAPAPAAAPASAQTSTPATAAAPSPAVKPEPASAPSFDVVRVNPAGDAVIAGRAVPGATVTIKDGETVLGTVTADSRGEWVYVPETPLTPGSRQLDLSATAPDGTVIAGERSVVLVIPERETMAAGRPDPALSAPLALSVPRAGAGATALLQAPGGGDDAKVLSLDVVDYDADGELILSGRAPANARVLAYLDGTLLGRADAGGDGRWSLKPARPVAPGDYTLRIDQVRDNGSVVARREMPFTRAVPEADPTPETVVVQPGNSLWRISRRIYGNGTAFTVIYRANADRIRDPDLIYPGQVFVLPPAGGG